MAEPSFTKARLIPVSGIGSAQEAEQRATSAFLAVLSVVRDLSMELLTPLGASRAQRAVVSLNGKSFPATEPYVVTEGEWLVYHLLQRGSSSASHAPASAPQLVFAKDGIALDNPY